MMSASSKIRSLFNFAALFISTWSCCGGAARAGEYEIVYHATLNDGGPPLALASFQNSPFAAGTPLTITAQFDSSTADQWNTGAYIYTVSSARFLIGSSTYETQDGLQILLSDPSWESVGGPYPYSAGFIGSEHGEPLGSITSLFGASTNAFDASNPAPTQFYEYELNYNFTAGPLSLFVFGPSGSGQLVLYNTSVSDGGATIFAVPELSTWAMLAFGFTGLGIAGRLHAWRTESRLATQ
jgi:hypothetical protein